MPHFDELKQTQMYDTIRRKEAEDLAMILASRYGLPFVDLGLISIDSAVIKLIPEDLAKKAGAVVFQLEQGAARVAVVTPNNPELPRVTEELERQGHRVELFMTSEYIIKRAWEIYSEVSYAKASTAGIISVSDATMAKYINGITGMEDIQKLVEDATSQGDIHAISTIAEIILGGAVAVGCSDIHLEPEKEVVRVRYRMDGILQDVATINHPNYRKVLSRIKLLARVKLNVVHEAQDGRFTIKINGVDVEVRTSVLPSAYQESVVMRILNPKNISVPFEELGMDEYLYKIMQDQISKPNGLILTTGPTGSGKTTTLYAILKKLRTPEVKIITIEDPIEYHVDGINQTQVDHSKGYDFKSGLRAAVRQDPDIMLVGEIRDNETATIAIDSALTGHLVFSTLHTNNAAGAVPRLIDLGVNPKIISSSLNIALAQRLVRKLCEHCKEAYVPEGKEKEDYDRVVAEILELHPEIKVPDHIYKAHGCQKCGFLGYKGRVSVYEGLLMNAEIDALLKEGNPSEREIREASKSQRIFLMHQDGINKVMKGITSISEIEDNIGLSTSR